MKNNKTFTISFLSILVFCFWTISVQAQFNPNNFYSDLKILDRPVAPITGSPLVGKFYTKNGDLIDPGQLQTPVIIREVQSYGSVDRININNKSFNITSGISKLLKADFETKNYKLKIQGFTNVRLIEATNFYNLPIAEGQMVVQALVVDGISTTRLNGDNNTASAALEKAVQKLAPTSGSVTISDNTFSAGFGTNLIIAVKLISIKRINNTTNLTAQGKLHDTAFKPTSDLQKYIVNVEQYSPDQLIPFGLKPENIYCMKFLLRNSAYPAVNQNLTTYCPAFSELSVERIQSYRPNENWNKSLQVPALTYVSGNNKIVKTLLTFENPQFTLNSSSPELIESMNFNFQLEELIFQISK